jgi:hypothetical protein
MAMSIEEKREKKRIYMKKWRRENKEKVKANQQRYWERKIMKMMGGRSK